jgi:hypothetical protein
VSGDADPVQLRDDTTRGRFEWTVDEHVAWVDYRLEGNDLLLLHAEVPAALGGRGLGTRLVRAVLLHLRSTPYRLVPVCPFVARVMREGSAST